MSNLLFLTAKQVADRWAAVGITGTGDKPISVKTLACWRSNGDGPQQAVVRTMGKVRYRLDDLRKYEKAAFGQVCDSPESSKTVHEQLQSHHRTMSDSTNRQAA
ncbi:MAG: hypothetical protein GYB52_09905 [Rhodospirillales bacterium]|nr:hypothetical protein [Rhodospirillales bacterium]MBR9816935.1 hypothetical protein [Rhodospirillales bacterium]